ncbi:MAG: prephenate dehydratase domain-containing protein [Thermoprotei archaeon]
MWSSKSLYSVVLFLRDPLGIYCLGPKGSFTYEAALSLGSNLVETNTISDVFEAVDSMPNRVGVVPIQNSLEGPVNETLDNLFVRKGVFVNRVVEHKIHLVLASHTGDQGFKRIYSHQHAIREVRRDLINSFGAEIVPVGSTSQAAMLASKDEYGAAICSKVAAELYGLKVILDGLQEDNNITKFGVISKHPSRIGDRTMLLATVPHKPGGLLKFLEPFYEEGINLTMIYSRPLRGSVWQYYFLLEFEGCLEDSNVDRCLKRLPAVSESMRVCGSYPIQRV